MTGFFGRIFGGKKKEKILEGPGALVEDILHELITTARFDLSYEVEFDSEAMSLRVEFFGADEEMLKTKEGQLLDAIQLYLKRVLQHQLPEDRINLSIDCAGFREQANDELLELADKLKDIALSKGKSVYFRALPPKDRKVVHQYLAEDGRVKSRSVGDGHYKKIKIYPARSGAPQEERGQRTTA